MSWFESATSSVFLFDFLFSSAQASDDQLRRYGTMSNHFVQFCIRIYTKSGDTQIL
jgi:hypothetical protein